MCERVEQEPRIAVSVDMKVNLGGYESVGASCMLSGITAGATGSEIRELLDTADMTFRLIREQMEAKLDVVKAEKIAARNGQRG